jgi:hypothetical protein
MKDCIENNAIEAKEITPALRLIVWGFWRGTRHGWKKQLIG